MHVRVAQIGLMLILSVGAGCASTARWNPIARPWKTRAEPVQDSSQAEDPDSKSAEHEPLIAKNSPAESPRQYQHDPGTRLLIETELRDLPQSEREQWIAHLNSIETREVAHVLRARRRQLPFEDSPPTGPMPADPEEDSTLPLAAAGHSLPGQSRNTPASAAVSSSDLSRIERLSAQQEPSDSADELPTDIAILHAESPLASTNSAVPESSLLAPPRPARFPKLPEWDHARIWPGSGKTTEPKVNTASASRPGLFGLPPMRGNRDEPPAAPATPTLEMPQAATPDHIDSITPLSPAASVWENEMRKLISLLEADAMVLQPGMSQADQREYLRRQIAIRMLYLMQNEPEQAQQVIEGLPVAEQEFWTALFWGLSTYVDDSSNIDSARRASLTIEQLRSAIHHLQVKANLELKNLSFCKKIGGFGVYETFATNQFVAGDPVLLYCEVRNFSSEETNAGDIRSVLKSTLEIQRDAPDGAVIQRNNFDPTEDRSRTPREDYFHSYRLDLPSQLTPGSYLLKLTVEDRISGKIATDSIRFEIQ